MKPIRMGRRGALVLAVGVVMASLGVAGATAASSGPAVVAAAAATGAPLVAVRTTATDLTWTTTLDYGKTAHGIYHYGKPGDIPIVWSDGKIGVVETVNGKLVWHLSNDDKTTAGIYTYGDAGDIPVVWSPGQIGFVHDDGTNLIWHLSIDRKTTHGIYTYGKHGDTPVVWGPGLIGAVTHTGASLQWHLSIDRQTTHGIFTYGKAGDIPVVWTPGQIGAITPTATGMQWHTSIDRTTTHAVFNFGLPGTGSTGLAFQLTPKPIVSTSTLRTKIITIANGEVGYQASPSLCQKYASLCDDWCAMFVIWVWEHAGVGDQPDTYVARGVGRWGVDNGLFTSRPAGGRGNPLPGDLVIYGTPAQVTGGHVSIVYSVNADGTITTIDGNFNNRVVKRVINPVTARAGGNDLLISGYVSPPGQ